MEISNTIAFKNYKHEIGNANHMLITIFVGLDGIVDLGVCKRDSLNVSWNPRDKQQSSDRAKIFAKKSCLSWIVDCMDMYFKTINEDKNRLIYSPLKDKLDGIDYSKSVFKRFDEISDYTKSKDSEFYLLKLLIAWRNKLTHSDFGMKIDDEILKKLNEHKDFYAVNYRGLDVNIAFESFMNNETPSLKELTSFIRASINFLMRIDSSLLKDVGSEKYAKGMMLYHLKKMTPQKRALLFCRDENSKYTSFKQILMQYGFFETTENEIDNLSKYLSKITQKIITENINSNILSRP